MLKVHNEKVEFQKTECLIKTIKKCIMKKLSVWLALIKVAIWGINYQKGQCIYKGIYFILFFLCEFISYLNQLLHHTKIKFSLSKKIIFFSPILANNNLPLKIYYENIVKILW